MAFFSSLREKRLWTAVVLVVLGIYASLGVVRPLADALTDRGIFDDCFILSFFLIGFSLLFYGLKSKTSKWDIGIWIGIIASYIMVFARISNPVERTHIMEFGVVAILILEALRERKANGKPVFNPPIIAFFATTLIGVIDECIQWFIPNRVFDTEDMQFNGIAAFMAISSSVVLRFARQRLTSKPH